MKNELEISHSNEQRLMSNSDFISYLKNELINRCKRNPNYSMRSFAKFLGISSSFFSKLLLYKRSLTIKMFEQLQTRLNLTPVQYDYYLQMLNSDCTKTINHDQIQFHQLAYDEFSVIADWYYFAILELITTQDFIPHPKYIAARLNISLIEAKEALEKLKKLNFIKEVDEKLVLTRDNNSTLGQTATKSAYQKQQEQILNKSLDALYEVPFELRSQTSVTMAISKKKLSVANDLIKQFRRQMIALLQDEEQENFDSVYQLSISFFPLTNEIPTTGKGRPL